MSNAVGQLAIELTKLSDEEWQKLAAERIAGRDWDRAFGPAWDEISERVAHCELAPGTADDPAHNEWMLPAESLGGNAAKDET